MPVLIEMEKSAALLGSTSNSEFAIEEGEHVIGAFIGKTSGPTLIVIGSLHGNEPSGARALLNVEPQLRSMIGDLNGRVYFLCGNTRALSHGIRFVDADLNRHWTAQNLSSPGSDAEGDASEDVELCELDQILDCILITAMDKVFVLDLHSTSADGMPFATVGDTLRNRDFARKFPVTILLGIEEQLDGTMLEHLNNAGAVTLGFEGGQHLSQKTVENHEALIWLALANSRILKPTDISGLKGFRDRLAADSKHARVFEVRYRHAISIEDNFEMDPGFNNFDQVVRGELLGKDRNGPVVARESGVLLMPLYQRLGEDGFFIGREISAFWLWLSGVLRGIGVQKVVHLLPGVQRDPNDDGTLIVNTRVARLFPLQVFHLLGFRRRRWVDNKLVVSRRRHDTDDPFRWNLD